MTQPLFSIVIPTYNRSNLFPLAVGSLLAQTFEDFEVVVSDNCSEDDTPQVARQFNDPRVKYVRTPQHYVIADSWEFGRRQATGKLVIMLSDDDAFVDSALERFAAAAERYDADFIFSAVAQYRDRSFPGAEKNTVECPGCSGTTRVVSADEFVHPLYRFRPTFDMHPSAFAFSKEIADFVHSRTGRFFWTNGVEFSAWPMTAVLAKKIVFIDAPLNILGRTAKSWGSNMGLCNPGKARIQAFIDDIDHARKHAPLNNFSTCNLMAEGMLTAKSLFPTEFAAYEFDEVQYLRATIGELLQRRSLGVDITAEMADVTQYAARKHPSLLPEVESRKAAAWPSATEILMRSIRTVGGNLGMRILSRRLRAYQLAQKLESGAHRSSFSASGDHFGFDDILGCAQFLGTYVRRMSRDSERGNSTSARTPVASSRKSLGSTASAS
jgi:glycosyltransferase involved in cell wall biosynthesis